MAQRTIVVKTCDVHGDETEATDTVVFGIGAERFEIDCCADHAGEIRNTLARYAGLGRKAQAQRRAAAPGAGRGKGGGGKFDFGAADLSAEERELALASGWAGRGRIKHEIMQLLADKRAAAAG